MAPAPVTARSDKLYPTAQAALTVLRSWVGRDAPPDVPPTMDGKTLTMALVDAAESGEPVDSTTAMMWQMLSVIGRERSEKLMPLMSNIRYRALFAKPCSKELKQVRVHIQRSTCRNNAAPFTLADLDLTRSFVD